MSGEWRWRAFAALSASELHAILKLRCDVFVMEQACAFAEIDGRDPDAFHLARLEGNDLAGCLRVFGPGDREPVCRIGRLAVAPEFRGTGLGHALMREALRFCADTFPDRDVALSAQNHLRDFYAGYGFQPVSDVYVEDNIPHVDMRRHNQHSKI